jgi:hypothetical protein
MLDHDGIRFDGVFTAPDLERAYRLAHAAENQRRARFTLVVSMATVLYFAVSDFVFLGLQFHLYIILGVRAVIILASLVVLGWLRAPRQPVAVDRIVLAWILMMGAALVYLSCARPLSYTSHAIVNVLYVALMYSLVPLPLARQVIAPLLVSFGVLFLGNWVNPWPDPAVLVVMAAALILANALGAEMSRELHCSKRRQFLALSRETEARRSLEHAVAEIKTLRGILPICTHCKHVWNDAGFWEQVEVYVRDQTHVEFSHGLCPTCARLHYPEIDWDKKGL